MWRHHGLLAITCMFVAARADVVVEEHMSNRSIGPEALWHVLPQDVQHSLSGLLTRHADAIGLEDPAVDAVLSNLLHDELESQQNTSFGDEDSGMLTDELTKLEDDRRKNDEKRDKEMQALKAKWELRAAQRESARLQHEHEADLAKERLQKEALQRQIKHEEFQKRSAEFVQKSKERRELAEKRRASMQEQHARNWERTSSLLRQVHDQLEIVTGGWKDAPFWDDFFRTSSTATRFSKLGFKHIEPAIRLAAILPQHNVLVLEPRGASLAHRLAEEFRTNQVAQALAHAYGDEGDEGYDVVVEVGLLDAMAMGGAQSDQETSKLEALRKAASKIADIVKAGGTWISISAVPPPLRIPLLGRLSGNRFSVPSEKEDAAAGTHAITLPAGETESKMRTNLRGAAQVADMLLYGSEDVHIWAYRMKHGDVPNVDRSQSLALPGEEQDHDLLDIVRQQRPGSRDDL
eukprot:TRINITY_DN67802_c0_g1_i1.p1 TRINITY_DN67802_c0_g1~~TRINITY_DN67802_c0_g1_i1.p1  ORF type:complete len:463 (+),score=67.33 TRINITY_DN67802_c0_g1_i1:99-1487(+)